MPRSPLIGAAAPLLLFLAALCPPSANAQSWGEASGYNALVTELGGAPATEYDEVVLIAEEDTAWSYRKGTSEASSPTDAWRDVGFSEDASWFQNAQTPIGYGDGDDNTELTDMRGNSGYTTVYLRRTFNLAAGTVPARLVLRVYSDDGAIVWINGKEVERFNVSDGFKAFDDTAASTRNNAIWDAYLIKDASEFLVEGANVIAVHGLNRTLNSTDFSIDAELISPALRVTQVEANPSGTRNYLPLTSPNTSPPQGYAFPGSGILSGQTFHTQSVSGGETFLQSSHSYNVANRYYSSNSLSPSLQLVDNYDASGWLGNDFLRESTFSAPHVESNICQNHSWIARPEDGTVDELNEIVRRQDYAIHRDGYLAMIGLNNGSGTSVPPVFGSGYNVVTVGLTNGNHSRNGTPVGFDGEGRIKPDIVASDSATSYSTPQIASAACLLLAHANARGWGKPFTSYVMKAILMAGATKSEFQTSSYTWSRTTTQPLDSVFGSGEMNVQNSYHILDAGEQDSATTTGHYGWDKASLPVSGMTTYTIRLDDDVAEFSCILTWNRTIDTAPWLSTGSYSETVADMSLELANGIGSGSTTYDSSDSTIDNVEHVYLRGLPAGTYSLTVNTDVAADFGIAWRADPGPLPTVTLAEGTTAGDADLALSNLAIGKEYTIKSSTDLVSWTGIHTFTATATTDSHTHPTGLSAPRTFYKITWNPVN